MDKLFIKELSSIFLAVSINVIQKFKISTSTSHLDSSSMHVHGEYTASFPEVIFEKSKSKNNPKKRKDEEKELEDENIESKRAINVTYGYSRDPSGSPLWRDGNRHRQVDSP
jgi:hypothetical protein